MWPFAFSTITDFSVQSIRRKKPESSANHQHHRLSRFLSYRSSASSIRLHRQAGTNRSLNTDLSSG
jgi:hypothetical protein